MAVNQGITHQLRRGTSTQMAVFIGALGEPTYDMTYARIVYHDAVTAGGWPVESASVQNFFASGSILSQTAYAYVYSTATVTVQLPSALAYPPGQRLTIVDALATSSLATFTVTAASSTEGIFSTAGASATSFTITGGTGGHIARIMVGSTGHWFGLYRA